MNENEETKTNIKLPDNAFTELKPGEEYIPVMSPDKEHPEVNVWSVAWGLVMAILFSGAVDPLVIESGITPDGSAVRWW